MKIPTTWTRVDGTKVRISRMSNIHIEECLAYLNYVMRKRGGKKYRPQPDMEFHYPHLGNEEKYVAAFVIEQARRRNAKR